MDSRLAFCGSVGGGDGTALTVRSAGTSRLHTSPACAVTSGRLERLAPLLRCLCAPVSLSCAPARTHQQPGPSLTLARLPTLTAVLAAPADEARGVLLEALLEDEQVAERRGLGRGRKRRRRRLRVRLMPRRRMQRTRRRKMWWGGEQSLYVNAYMVSHLADCVSQVSFASLRRRQRG